MKSRCPTRFAQHYQRSPRRQTHLGPVSMLAAATPAASGTRSPMTWRAPEPPAVAVLLARRLPPVPPCCSLPPPSPPSPHWRSMPPRPHRAAVVARLVVLSHCRRSPPSPSCASLVTARAPRSRLQTTSRLSEPLEVALLWASASPPDSSVNHRLGNRCCHRRRHQSRLPKTSRCPNRWKRLRYSRSRRRRPAIIAAAAYARDAAARSARHIRRR